jgi:hypothetical protein
MKERLEIKLLNSFPQIALVKFTSQYRALTGAQPLPRLEFREEWFRGWTPPSESVLAELSLALSTCHSYWASLAWKCWFDYSKPYAIVWRWLGESISKWPPSAANALTSLCIRRPIVESAIDDDPMWTDLFNRFTALDLDDRCKRYEVLRFLFDRFDPRAAQLLLEYHRKESTVQPGDWADLMSWSLQRGELDALVGSERTFDSLWKAIKRALDGMGALSSQFILEVREPEAWRWTW